MATSTISRWRSWRPPAWKLPDNTSPTKPSEPTKPVSAESSEGFVGFDTGAIPENFPRQDGPERAGISPSEWEAHQINRVFDEHAQQKRGGRITTSSTVEDGELKHRWAERWPEKPFGDLDDESGSGLSRCSTKLARESFGLETNVAWQCGLSRMARSSGLPCGCSG